MMKQPQTMQQLFLQDARSATSEKLPEGGRPLLFMTITVVVVFLLWASFSEVDEITRGSGKVVPSSRIQEIQNLEGGIISKILVEEGVTVEKGQVLLEMDDTRFNSNLQEQKVSREALLARKSRLVAEIEQTNFSVPETLAEVMPELVMREQELFESRKLEIESKRSVLEQQWIQNQKQLEETYEKETLLGKRIVLLEEELQMVRAMATDGAASRAEVLRMERQHIDTEGELNITRKSIGRLKAALSESKEKLDELSLGFKNKARLDLNETLATLNELSASEMALEDRVERTNVRSPVRGIVKSILVNTQGGVVQPGMAMMEIVPLDDSLHIEARIRPEDIGFLHPDQKATVRFSAYDFTVYGGLNGELTHISADTITDEQGESYYLAFIETEKNDLVTKEGEKPVIPGMVATVDIVTGKKSLMAYLLKPVLRAKQLAFTER